MTLNKWNVGYLETMKAAEKARQNVAAKTNSYALPRHVRWFMQLDLVWPFMTVTRDTRKLVSLLELMETFPSSFLLEEYALEFPQSLQELFKKMSTVLQKTESAGLHQGLVLKGYVKDLATLNQEIGEFAARYSDAQQKLLSRVPAEHVEAYKTSFAAYANCHPKPSQGVHEDDLDTELLHF